jgi:type I restriction enzyme S subunit
VTESRRDLTERTSFHVPAAQKPLQPGWAWHRLDGVAEAVVDCPHSTPSLTESGPYVVRSQDIRTRVFRTDGAAHVSEETYRDRVQRAEPTYGDLVYSREGAYFGIAAEVPVRTRMCLGQRMVLIRPDPRRVDHRYLLYWLNSPILASHTSGFRDGSVAERFNLPTIRALPVAVPPLRIQHAIAHILGALDDKIELNRKMNETLEQMARAIFKACFTYPFEGLPMLMSGKPPSSFPLPVGEVGRRSSEGHLELLDSPRGKIPKGWKVKPLPEAIEVNPPRVLRKGCIAPYLDMQNMPARGHRPAGWIQRAFGSGTRYVNGDTLVARITPCLENGKTAFVDFLGDGQVGWGSTEFLVLRPKPPLPEYHGYLLARSEEFRSHAIQNMTGSSGRQRVPPECLAQFDVVVPDATVAVRFGTLVAPLAQRIRGNSEQSRTLAAVRDALLPKLMSGEVRVGGVALT